MAILGKVVLGVLGVGLLFAAWFVASLSRAFSQWGF